MKTTITQSERLQLLGLLTLSRSHRKLIDRCETEMNTILENDDKWGSLLTDAVWEDTDIDEILKNMNIEVQE